MADTDLDHSIIGRREAKITPKSGGNVEVSVHIQARRDHMDKPTGQENIGKLYDALMSDGTITHDNIPKRQACVDSCAIDIRLLVRAGIAEQTKQQLEKIIADAGKDIGLKILTKGPQHKSKPNIFRRQHSGESSHRG